MNERMKAAGLGALAAIATVALGVGLVLALGGDDDDGDSDETAVIRTVEETGPASVPEGTPDPDDVPISPGELGRVAEAAERHVGGGRAVDVERSDDPGEAFEVEVWTERGEVDVALDEQLDRVPNAPYED